MKPYFNRSQNKMRISFTLDERAQFFAQFLAAAIASGKSCQRECDAWTEASFAFDEFEKELAVAAHLDYIENQELDCDELSRAIAEQTKADK